MKHKHLLGLENYPAEDIQTIIQTAFSFREVLDRPIKKVPSLQGKNFSSSSSSLQKGETFKDTVQNIEAMKIDAVVMRHPTPGAPLHLTKHIDAIVINAGDGAREHPTQAILDMTSLHEKFGYLKGLKIGIIGDISHSRVALSNIHGLKTMGAEVTLCGPATLIPPHAEELGVNVNYNLDEVIKWADALNVLRIQRERMSGGLLPSVREYRNLFGITPERLANQKKELIIMHPGPMNRGVEIDSTVADSDQAIILDQVLNGVASRMAILYLLLGGKQEEEKN